MHASPLIARRTFTDADFTVDMALARQSIVKIGGLAFDALLVGHGEPLEGGASAAVAVLAAAG